MLCRKLAQQGMAIGGEDDTHLAAVNVGGSPFDKAAAFGTVHEFDGAVVADQQPFGYLGDGDALLRAPRLEGEDELVLLGVESCGPGSGLAEVQEAPDGEPEFMEQFIIAL